MRIEYLPAYSPDLNPIEEAFSAMKARFRRDYGHFARDASTGTDPEDAAKTVLMLLEVVHSITPDNARAFFQHSHYIL